MAPRGFRGLLASDLPQGAGLSSSAAIEVRRRVGALGRRPAAGRPDGPRPCRRSAPRTATSASTTGSWTSSRRSSASRATRCCSTAARSSTARSRCRLDDVTLVACHSGSPRRLETSAYNERRSQCEAAVAAIAAIRARRDLPARRHARDARRGPRPRWTTSPARRAEHIVDENGRVLAAIAAFEAGDLDEVGRLFYASHASMRDLYEVSSPELDALVEIAQATPGVIGARLTGAGLRRLHDQPRPARRRRTAARGRVARLPGAHRPDATRVRGRGLGRRAPARLTGRPITPERGPPRDRGAPSRGGARRRRTASGRPSPGISR